MAYQNTKYYYGWSPSNEYQGYEAAEEPALRRPHDNPRHTKGHRVAFKTNYEEPIAAESVEDPRVVAAETETATERIRYNNHNAYGNVDQEAEAFIHQEHRRIELAKLMSMRAAQQTYQ